MAMHRAVCASSRSASQASLVLRVSEAALGPDCTCPLKHAVCCNFPACPSPAAQSPPLSARGWQQDLVGCVGCSS